MVLAVAFALLIVGACAHSQSPSIPTAPNTAGIIGQVDSTGSGFHPGHNLLGLWSVTVDSEQGTVLIVPVRVANVHLNVLSFLEIGPCTDCLDITHFEKDIDKNYLIDITLTHPFSTMPKFSGFDVRGICMFNAGLNFESFGQTLASLGQGTPELLNADGFTTLYMPATAGNGFQGYLKGKLAPPLPDPTATLNGYKYFCDSIPDPDDLTDPTELLDPAYVTDRGVFRAGEVNTRRYKMKSSNPIFTFGYAVDASWAKPTEPVTVPDSFPATANCPEAWLVQAEMAGPLATTAGATANLIIDIFDRQGAASISTVSVECAPPALWDGLITATKQAGGPGTQRYVAVVVNEFGYFPPGTYTALVRALDMQSSPGALIDNIAWQVVRIPVITNHPPSCAAEVSNPEPDIDEVITFTDTSTDLDGPGDLNESWWDWENDGTWDEEGFEADHSFDSEGIFKVNHKVIDNAGAEDDLNDPLQLDVGTFITLQEDLNCKPIDRDYRYLTLDDSYGTGGIINVSDLDGPWDFTTIGLAAPQASVLILDDSDSEVAGFVDEFNSNTTHFVKITGFFDPFLPVIYQAEYHYFSGSGDRLYIYGFYDPDLIGAAKFGPPDTDEYLVIPFPLSEATDYVYTISNPGLNLEYSVKAIGVGVATVPYDGGTEYNCILLRYRFIIAAGGPVNGSFINFAFVSDEGIVVANVIAVNQPPSTYNWNPSANSIIGTAHFQALNNILN
jgi:hypothetical protein